MLNNFPENIPLTYYYNFDNETFIINNINNNGKLIKKPNENCFANGIIVFDNIDFIFLIINLYEIYFLI